MYLEAIIICKPMRNYPSRGASVERYSIELYVWDGFQLWKVFIKMSVQLQTEVDRAQSDVNTVDASTHVVSQ